MKPIWIVGSNVDTSSPILTPSEKLEQESEERKKRNEDRDLNKKNSETFDKISTNIRGLVRGFTSLFKGGTGNSSSGTTTNSGLSLNLNNDALMRVFNDTWEYEMGKRGPGTIAEPLDDGAGKNYGVASLTQKWNMSSFREWLKTRYPNLESKLVGETCSEIFDASWKKLGETNEQEFLKAQIEFTFESKLIPWINKIKSDTGVDLNNGKYSEGVFSILLSMSNQRPAWIDDLVVPWFKDHPNATSADIINGLGGYVANSYNGVYADAIRSRYQKQVAHSLTMTTPFSLTGSTSSSGTINLSSNNSSKGSSSVVYNQNTSNISTATANNQKYMNPLSGHPISAKFSDEHQGIDIDASMGTKIKAMADGTISRVETGYNNGKGSYVVIKHKNGDFTKYQYLNSINVKEGDTIKQGDIIGEVGSSGNSSYPHLHLEMTRDGKLVDPEKYIGTSVTTNSSSNKSTITNTSSSTYSAGGVGTFDSTYAITDDEKAQNEAQQYWKSYRESGNHAYNSIHNDTTKGENKATVVKNNTSGWKSDYIKTNEDLSSFNTNRTTYDASKTANFKSPYEKIHNSNSTPSYSTPSKDTVTKIDSSTIIIPITSDSSKPSYTPPSSLIEIKNPVTPDNSSSNNGNGNSNTTVSPTNPTYYFDKEKYEKILNSLSLINDYTGEIKTTNELLTKMKKVISDNKEKCKKAHSSKNSSSSANNNLYDSLFRNSNSIENQFYFGF